MNRDTPEWQSAVDRALEKSGHGAHGGYDITADGIIVCAWDGEPVADARTVTAHPEITAGLNERTGEAT